MSALSYKIGREEEIWKGKDYDDNDLSSKKVFISRHVLFNEHVFPFSTSNSSFFPLDDYVSFDSNVPKDSLPLATDISLSLAFQH